MSATIKPLTVLAQIRRDPEAELEHRPLSWSLYRRMLAYATAYRGIFVTLLVLVVVRSIQLPLVEWAFTAVINGPITTGDLPGLFLATLVYIAMALFTQGTLYYRSLLAMTLGEGIVHDLRSDIFGKLQTLNMSFFTRTKLGRIISRVTSDSESVRQGVQDAVFMSVVALGQIVVALVIMAFTDGALFLVVACTAPAYYLTYTYFKARMVKAHRENLESFSRLTTNLAETVTGIRVTQGFVRQDRNARLWNTLVRDHEDYNMATARASGTFNPVLEMLNAVVVALILAVGGYRILAPEIHASVSDLILFYFLVNNVLGPIGALGSTYTTAVNSMAGAERVFALLDREPEFVDAPDAFDPPPLRGRVEFRDLGFEYETGKPVLHHVTFTAQPGQTIALVGHTGSGKTSIINLIAKFYVPTSGQLLIDDHDILSLRSDGLHRQMGIVLQVNFLFTGTVMDNIRVGRPTATDQEVIEAARRLDVLDVMESLPQGWATVVGERGTGLSLGQRQLVCFTRAMLADPRIMILDEATSSVDTLTEVRVQTALARLLMGRTSFVVAHRLSTIRQADLILVLDHGRIVERGSHLDLLCNNGVYAGLYRQFVQASQA